MLLLSCYELGHQPLGLAAPLAFLERAGYSPRAIDLSLDALDEEAVRRADLVAVSVPMHTAARLGVDVAQTVRALNPRAHLAFFGLYASLNGEHFLAEICDSVWGGEVEEAIVELADSLERGEARALPPPAVVLQKLRFPAPSRAELPSLDRYAKLEIGAEQRLAGAVESTRGCRYLCRHCPIPPLYGGRLFALPVETVMADVRALVERGAEHITFADPDFLNAPTHARRVARALHHAYPKLSFDFTAKIEHLVKHASLLPELVSHGARFVVSAVESLSDRVLSILDKGHARDDVFTALDITGRAGLALRPSLLPFTPWSTLEDYGELLHMVIERGLARHVDPVQLSIRLLVPPGSLLEHHSEMKPHLVRLDRAALTWRWRHPDARVDRLNEVVTAIVEDASRESRDPETTLADLSMAYEESVGGTTVPKGRRDELWRSIRAHASVGPVPRLTESWFCCAEPLSTPTKTRCCG